jgi:hypothetical protein
MIQHKEFDHSPTRGVIVSGGGGGIAGLSAAIYPGHAHAGVFLNET